MNLDEKLKQYPEAQWIVNQAFNNSKKDASGRRHGELTKKELLSYTKAIENAQSARIRELEGALEVCRDSFEVLERKFNLPMEAHYYLIDETLNKKEQS